VLLQFRITAVRAIRAGFIAINFNKCLHRYAMVIAAAQDASRTKIYENNAVSVKFTENYKVEIICIVGIACYIV